MNLSKYGANHKHMIGDDGSIDESACIDEERSFENHVPTDRSKDLQYACALDLSFDEVSSADNGVRAILQCLPPYRWELVSMSMLPLYSAPSAISTRGAAISPSIRPPGLISRSSDT